jgi:hypothetical protein
VSSGSKSLSVAGVGPENGLDDQQTPRVGGADRRIAGTITSFRVVSSWLGASVKIAKDFKPTPTPRATRA